MATLATTSVLIGRFRIGQPNGCGETYFSEGYGLKCPRENRKKETAGPSTALRSGRDDNSVAGKWPQKRSDEWLLMVPQNCHPDRSEPGFPVTRPSSTPTCAAFSKESRMKFAKATNIHRESGVAQWRDLRFLFPFPRRNEASPHPESSLSWDFPQATEPSFAR
jgi:hypothetical protein